jgi:hypothetical protein
MGGRSENDRYERNCPDFAAMEGSAHGGLLDGVGPAAGELTVSSLLRDAFRRLLAAFPVRPGRLHEASAGKGAAGDGLSLPAHRESMAAEADLIRLRQEHAAAETADPAAAAIDKRHGCEDERHDCRRRRPSLAYSRAG